MAEAQNRRLRIAHVIVQPVLVYDDDVELTPGPATQPIQVALSELAGLAERIRAELAAMTDVDTNGSTQPVAVTET